MPSAHCPKHALEAMHWSPPAPTRTVFSCKGGAACAQRHAPYSWTRKRRGSTIQVWCRACWAGIRDKQRKLQEAHERTKTVTRTGEMKDIRERMQVAAIHRPLFWGPCLACNEIRGCLSYHAHALQWHVLKGCCCPNGFP